MGLNDIKVSLKKTKVEYKEKYYKMRKNSSL